MYSIARTESAFDQRDMSPAKAVELMQVTPEAGRDTAKRFSVAYDWNRLVSDPVYNTQMGAAEVAALLQEYRGSYIMTFAGYNNAGRGRVQQFQDVYRGDIVCIGLCKNAGRFKGAPATSALPPISDVLLSRSKRRSGPQKPIASARCASG